jgi:hypothetical protein
MSNRPRRTQRAEDDPELPEPMEQEPQQMEVAENPTQQLAQALVQALQILQGQAPAQAPAMPALTTVSPYEGGALDFTSRHGANLYFEASKPLRTKYTGKPGEVRFFIADLKERASRCRWNSILTFQKNGISLDLLNDYGQLSESDVNAARILRDSDVNDPTLVREKQNALMMYNCIYESLEETPKSKIIAEQIPRDGPTLFFRLMQAAHTTTFSHQFTIRERLMKLSPKAFNYDIKSMNVHVQGELQVLSASGHPLSDNEIIFLLFRAYSTIKTPHEWVSFVDNVKNRYELDGQLKPAKLMDDMESKFQSLKDDKRWKPSDKSLEEDFVAMISEYKKKLGNNNGNNKNSKGKDGEKAKGNKNNKKANNKPATVKNKDLPFANESGKEGDTKEHEGVTYYYCDGPHKNDLHWVQHKPGDCNAKQSKGEKKSGNSNAKSDDKPRVTTDRRKLQALASILEAHKDDSTDSDFSDTIEAMLAALQE